ncbi:transcription factor iws1 [Pisolithus albus]|nr:transcription factor iws1 [Pisolithus albus]
MAPTHDDLERDIFGDGSELSSEEEGTSSHHPLSAYPERPPVEEDAFASSGESSEGYVQERPKKQKRKVKSRGDVEDSQPTRRKRKRKQLTEEDLNELPPEKANKLRLDMQFDAILKSKKSSRPKKRKNDEDVLDRYADEEVSRLREAMLNAAADDEQANRDKLPATNKLKLLPQVMEVLRKQSLSQSIMDNNLLEGVRRWLEPLPDRSLPALNIQRDFFPILRKMEFIDSPRVHPDIQRIANDLVSTWSRPIIKRSASYRDRVIPVAEDESAERNNERLNAILARAKEQEKNRIRKNAVMIPQRQYGSYTVAPRATAGILKNNPAVDHDVVRRKLNNERLKTLSRKMSTRG